MRLSRKLARLGHPMPAPDAAKRATVKRLQGMLDALATKHQREASRSARKPGRPMENASTGGVRVVEQILEPDHVYGKTPVQTALAAEAQVIAKLALDPELASIDPSRMLFLDTETTGLSGGTGTIPFLVGIAWFEDQSLLVEQLLLEEIAEESRLLERLAHHLSRSTCLVTYNGKSHDWPILTNRFVLNRVEIPKPIPHLDLLHLARRIYRTRLGRVRLVNVEQDVLGMVREHDIDGAEIPTLYWSYQRHRIDAALTPVLEHNLNDLIALAGLLGTVADRFVELHLEDDPRDHLGLAKVAARADDPERAYRFAVAAAEGGGDPAVAVEAYSLAAALESKKQRYGRAAQLFCEAVRAAEGDPVLSAPARLALAKLYEHKLKDLDRALANARCTEGAEPPAAQEKRVRRLERRIARNLTNQNH